jgi:hypothetical protein
VLTAIAYSLLVASNTGQEVLGFSLLLVSSVAIAWWALLGKQRGILLLQFFYAAAGRLDCTRAPNDLTPNLGDGYHPIAVYDHAGHGL